MMITLEFICTVKTKTCKKFSNTIYKKSFLKKIVFSQLNVKFEVRLLLINKIDPEENIVNRFENNYESFLGYGFPKFIRNQVSNFSLLNLIFKKFNLIYFLRTYLKMVSTTILMILLT